MKKEDTSSNTLVTILATISVLYIAEGISILLRENTQLSPLIFFLSCTSAVSALGWHMKRKVFLWFITLVGVVSLLYGIAALTNLSLAEVSSPAILFYLLFVISGVSTTFLTLHELKKR